MCDSYSVFKIDLHLFEILGSWKYQYFRVETNDVRVDLTNVSANSSALVCRWFTFQYNMEELMHELDNLQWAIQDLLSALPSNPYYRACDTEREGLSDPLLPK